MRQFLLCNLVLLVGCSAQKREPPPQPREPAPQEQQRSEKAECCQSAKPAVPGVRHLTITAMDGKVTWSGKCIGHVELIRGNPASVFWHDPYGAVYQMMLAPGSIVRVGLVDLPKVEEKPMPKAD